LAGGRNPPVAVLGSATSSGGTTKPPGAGASPTPKGSSRFYPLAARQATLVSYQVSRRDVGVGSQPDDWDHHGAAMTWQAASQNRARLPSRSPVTRRPSATSRCGAGGSAGSFRWCCSR